MIASLVGRRLSYFLISLATFSVSTFLFLQLNPHVLFPYAFLLGLFGGDDLLWLAPAVLPELFQLVVDRDGISFNTGQ
ncbi:MAG: hypothetical protein U0936_11295 [Planctomycetaceae bacterium]